MIEEEDELPLAPNAPRPLLSDHAPQFITCKFEKTTEKESYCFSVSGVTLNALSQMLPHNNPWGTKETWENFAKRRIQQMDEIIGWLKAGNDFVLLQEFSLVNTLAEEEGEDLEHIFKKKLKAAGFEYLNSPPTTINDDDKEQKNLKVVYNPEKITPTKKTESLFIDNSDNTYKGYEWRFTHVKSNQKFALTNVHLPYNDDKLNNQPFSKSISTYQLEKLSFNIPTIIGGDTNHPLNSFTTALGNPQLATNLAMKDKNHPEAGVTHFDDHEENVDQQIPKSYDLFFVNPGQNGKVEASIHPHYFKPHETEDGKIGYTLEASQKILVYQSGKGKTLTSKDLFKIKNVEKPVFKEDVTQNDEEGYRAQATMPGTATTIGIAEFKNKRPQQEDTFSYAWLPEFSLLTEDQKKAALENTVKVLQAEIVENKIGQFEGANAINSQGSCFISVVKEKIGDNTYHLHITNLGDSRAFLVTFNENSFPTITRLNENLHNPWEETEKQRILAENNNDPSVISADNRLHGRITLSRSLGDTQDDGTVRLTYPDGKKTTLKGLSHIPEINNEAITLKKGQEAYIIVACDGLQDNNCLSDNEIAALVHQYGNMGKNSPSFIADILAQEAITKKSGDNITVLACPLKGEETLVLNVNDGHGGDLVSRYIKENHSRILKQEVFKQFPVTNYWHHKDIFIRSVQEKSSFPEFKTLPLLACQILAVLDNEIYKCEDEAEKQALMQNFSGYLARMNNVLDTNAVHNPEKAQKAAHELMRYTIKMFDTFEYKPWKMLLGGSIGVIGLVGGAAGIILLASTAPFSMPWLALAMLGIALVGGIATVGGLNLFSQKSTRIEEKNVKYKNIAESIINPAKNGTLFPLELQIKNNANGQINEGSKEKVRISMKPKNKIDTFEISTIKELTTFSSNCYGTVSLLPKCTGEDKDPFNDGGKFILRFDRVPETEWEKIKVLLKEGLLFGGELCPVDKTQGYNDFKITLEVYHADDYAVMLKTYETILATGLAENAVGGEAGITFKTNKESRPDHPNYKSPGEICTLEKIFQWKKQALEKRSCKKDFENKEGLRDSLLY